MTYDEDTLHGLTIEQVTHLAGMEIPHLSALARSYLLAKDRETSSAIGYREVTIAPSSAVLDCIGGTRVFPSDHFTYTRTVVFEWDRGKGPTMEQPIRHARVTSARVTYRYEPRTGWITDIGPVHGHVYDDDQRLGSRARSLHPRLSGWPSWLLELAQEHLPTTSIRVQEH